MKNLVGLLIGLAALTIVTMLAFALANRAFNRQDPREGQPSVPRAHITCFSGGKLILDDYATGNIEDRDSGEYQFRSRTTGQRIRTTADCVAVYGATPAAGFQPVLP